MFRSSEETEILNWKLQLLKTLFYLDQKGMLRDLKHEPIDLYVTDIYGEYINIDDMIDLFDILGFYVEGAISIRDEVLSEFDDKLFEVIQDLFYELYSINIDELYQVTLYNPTVLKALEIAQDKDKEDLKVRIEGLFETCKMFVEVSNSELKEYAANKSFTAEELCLINKGIDIVIDCIDGILFNEYGVESFLNLWEVERLYDCLYDFMKNIYDFSLDIIQRSSNKEEDVHGKLERKVG